MSRPRLPDFVIIGAGKSGTTTLHHWLCEQPEIFAPSLKEPRFFSRDWDKGVDWYAGLFATSPDDQLVGEASTNYTDAEYSDVASERMARTIPHARLVYLLRHPVERLRSQYRHNWRRAVESAALVDAVLRPGNPYVGRSLYHSRLLPYAERFPQEQICVVRFEDLVSEPQPGWTTVLHHLGLEQRPAPGDAYNVTVGQPAVTPFVRRLHTGGWIGRLPIPGAVRERGKQALTRLGRRPGAEADAELPEPVLAELWADVARLEAMLGVGRLWERTD